MADAGKLDLKVVTPEGSLFAGAAAFVAAPGAEGELGILPGHAALIATLGTGGLRIQTDEGLRNYAVRGGFLQVLKNQVMLLAAEAQSPDDVDADSLRAERDEVLEKLRHPASDEEYAALLEARRWLEAREKLVA